MHTKATIRTAAAFLPVVAAMACADAPLTQPALPTAVAAQAIPDAVDTPASEPIVLHGSGGRVYRFTLHGNDLVLESGKVLRIDRDIATQLRRMSRIDAKLERLIEAARPIWRAHGLADPDAARSEARFLRVPADSATARSLAGMDVCANLYIALYDDTRFWHAAVDDFTESAFGSFENCFGDFSVMCVPSLDALAVHMSRLAFWEADLNEIAWELGFHGC